MPQHAPALFGLAAALAIPSLATAQTPAFDLPTDLLWPAPLESTLFDEGTLGDFPGDSFFNSGVFLDIGVLGAGSHTITGSITGNSPQDLSDTVLFEIEPGFVITSLSVSFTNATFGDGTSRVLAQLRSPAVLDEARLNADTTFQQFDAAPHGPGIYYLFATINGGVPGTATDYQIDLTVDVPAPGAGVVLGLIGLAAARRRR